MKGRGRRRRRRRRRRRKGREGKRGEGVNTFGGKGRKGGEKEKRGTLEVFHLLGCILLGRRI